MMLLTLTAVSTLSWIYLWLGRGGFWRVRGAMSRRATAGSGRAARIVAVIPARNEAATIGETVRSLLAQELAIPLRIVLVDDGSSDGTAEIAAGIGNVTVLKGLPLPAGWSGKVWALSQGIERAGEDRPDYLLLTDADIRYEEGSLQALLCLAQEHATDLTSLMVKLARRSWAEKLCIPAFVFFFFQLYPPRWISSRTARTAGAAGGCMLVRPESLQRAGGIGQIRGALIDDCALARLIKRSGGRVWLGLTPTVSSLRSYGTLAEVRGMIARTAFYQLRHSGVLLAGTALGLLVVYVVPVAALASGSVYAFALGGTSTLLMLRLYLPMVRFYGGSPLWALTLPGAALFYLGATMDSAFQYWLGKGGQWKGRAQDRRE